MPSARTAPHSSPTPAMTPAAPPSSQPVHTSSPLPQPASPWHQPLLDTQIPSMPLMPKSQTLRPKRQSRPPAPTPTALRCASPSRSTTWALAATLPGPTPSTTSRCTTLRHSLLSKERQRPQHCERLPRPRPSPARRAVPEFALPTPRLIATLQMPMAPLLPRTPTPWLAPAASPEASATTVPDLTTRV